ncbi:MAG TPA: hypothetical protein VHX18_07695 [Rhizomicrobium sp.]|jgi:hypothetical protein|nr:hypothetical protein [Rhizomicrobium sp.]
MSRKAIGVIVSLIFSLSAALACQPLPSGKPAGVRHAQKATYGAIGVGALALIAIAGYAISTHPYQLPGSAIATTSTQP